MNWRLVTRIRPLSVVVAVFFSFPVASAHAGAEIDGITGPNFNLTAKVGCVSGADGLSLHLWGYANANGGGLAQYPGPTLILDEDVPVTIELTVDAAMPENVSIVFPGQIGVTPSGGVEGLLTREAEPGGASVTYSFAPTEPGTYHYHSGTHMDLQIEMGLVGAIIVRPTGFDPGNPRAYAHADSAYDHEYLFFLTEMDLDIHRLVEYGRMDEVDTTTFYPVYWFINGRNAPDTMLPAGIPWLPAQPYNCLPRMRPGEKLLMRIVGAGRDSHPFHPHGNNARIIAADGRVLTSDPNDPNAGADLAVSDFTLKSVPGQTLDAIFEWTGAALGWDIYGHEQDIDNPPEGNFPGPEDVDHNGDGVFDSVPLETDEHEPDHGKPFPVILPGQQDLTFGAAYSGSPFLGVSGDFPPGEGGLNANAGYFYMWHSHNEKEMVNNDIFPGGMMTMLIIEPPGVPIP